MAMSRKHYREVADLLAGEHAIAPTPDVVTAVENITRSVADMFKRDNGRFNRQRFYDAARLGESELAHTIAEYERGCNVLAGLNADGSVDDVPVRIGA